MFQYGAGLLRGDAGKPLNKFGELCPVFEILEQRGNGNARATKYPGATDTLRIPLDSRARRPINHRVIVDLAQG